MISAGIITDGKAREIVQLHCLPNKGDVLVYHGGFFEVEKVQHLISPGAHMNDGHFIEIESKTISPKKQSNK